MDENKSIGSANLQSCAVCVDEVGHGLSPSQELTARPLNSEVYSSLKRIAVSLLPIEILSLCACVMRTVFRVIRSRLLYMLCFVCKCARKESYMINQMTCFLYA